MQVRVPVDLRDPRVHPHWWVAQRLWVRLAEGAVVEVSPLDRPKVRPIVQLPRAELAGVWVEVGLDCRLCPANSAGWRGSD